MNKKTFGYWPAVAGLGGAIMLSAILVTEARRPVMTVSQATTQVPGPDCRGTDRAPQLTTIRRSTDYHPTISSRAIFDEWVNRHQSSINIKSVSVDGNRIDVLWECK